LAVRLLLPFSGHNRVVHIDNYYTSIPLVLELQNINILTTGTIRTNRKGLCKEITIKKSEEALLKKKPGYTRFASYGSLTYIAWMDKRPVHMLTNCYAPISDDLFVTHWYPAKPNEPGSLNGKVQKEVSISPAVYYYNQYMGGVDTFDQYRSYIKLELKSYKYWHPMMWFILESALVNAWVLYIKTIKKAQLEQRYSHFEF
jgi:hypothetical protein